MKAIKNILVGFLVSFIGSLPLGYLNVLGFEIYRNSGIDDLSLFLFGVITVEIFVIYYTLKFANQLLSKAKLLKYIEIFSIFFLLLIAFSFYMYANVTPKTEIQLVQYAGYSPFLIGVFFNCLNVIQIPFWAGWNLYFVKENYVSMVNNNKYYYVLGTIIGTFFGMLSIILVLHSIAINTEIFSKYILPIVIPLVFVGISMFQMFKVYKKYYKSKN